MIWEERFVLSKKKRLVVIDGKSVFYRGYYAMPNLATKEGTPTGGVYGFAVMALEVLKKMNPDYVCVAWDKPKTNIGRRREIYPEYKANRKPAPPDFYEQIPVLHSLLDAFGWPFYEIDDHEADDIMGTFALQAAEKGYETILVTSDHDVLQLVNDSTVIAMLKKGLTNIDYYDDAALMHKYQLTPAQFVDYKSLRGDPSDNLPGVPGVGEKTATELVKTYGSMDTIYERLDEIKGSVQTKLRDNKDVAYITRSLVLLDLHVPLKLDWKQADVTNTKPQAVAQILNDLEFRTLLKQLPKDMQVDPDKLNHAVNTFKVDCTIKAIQSASELDTLPLNNVKELMLHTYTAGPVNTDLQVLLLSTDKKEVYVLDMSENLTPEAVVKHLRPVLEDKSVAKIAYDIKTTLRTFLQLDVELKNIAHDIRMAAFLINSLLREQALSKLARDELGYEGADLDDIPPHELVQKADTFAAVLWALYEAQEAQFKKIPKIEKLAREIEWPVMAVLAKMEVEGIGLDTKYLAKMSKELERSIAQTEKEIHGYAGKEFNVASPSQLAEVLFVDMKLPTQFIKKTKTGYSTAASELDKLRGEHPIIDCVTKFREVSKLKNTYVDTLPEQVDENSRLHTTFAMAVAPTGRLSSLNPNLQNIPVRSELGRQIRTAFVARDGYVFVSADYSQFELRLAAVLAGDSELIEAFNDGLDIHTRTASQVYGVALEDVTKNQRRDAKVINFGILYGMSPHGLSVATGMSQKDARDFIERYFELRKPILEYIDKTKEQAKEGGFVETMFGRRRPTPDVRSSNFVVREAALRAAVNMPIQGTEADLMKMAMIEVDKKLDADCKQLLQIHDSILVECPEDKAEKVGDLLKNTMESVYELPVKLDVDVDSGKNWGEI